VWNLVPRHQYKELTRTTDIAGHFYFTKLLLPVLIATAKSSPEGISRVVTTSSMAHMMISRLDFSKFKDSPARRQASSQFNLYPQSKYVCVPMISVLSAAVLTAVHRAISYLRRSLLAVMAIKGLFQPPSIQVCQIPPPIVCLLTGIQASYRLNLYVTLLQQSKLAQS
jgi:hypothetical protein